MRREIPSSDVCTVPCRIFLQELLILILAQSILTCVSSPWQEPMTVVKMSPQGPMTCLILSVTASSVMWFLYVVSLVACNFYRMSAVNVRVSQAFNSTDITRERTSLIFELRELCLSFQMVFMQSR